MLYSGALTPEDTAVALLLAEANAEAYAYTAYQEALHFHPELASTYRPATDRISLSGTFNNAFDDAWAANANASTAVRRERALEAGGQAISNGLLMGGSPHWTQYYSNLTVQNLNAHGDRYASGNERHYAETRADIFSRLGRVSDTINMTPDRLLDNDRVQVATLSILSAYGIRLS